MRDLDAILDAAQRQEAACRRGVHQALCRARMVAESSPDLATARARLARMEAAAAEARIDRTPAGSLLDAIATEATAAMTPETP